MDDRRLLTWPMLLASRILSAFSVTKVARRPISRYFFHVKINVPRYVRYSRRTIKFFAYNPNVFSVLLDSVISSFVGFTVRHLLPVRTNRR